MNRWMRVFSGWQGVALLCLAVMSLGATPALAQKPALVKNTDEPGRMPWEAEAEFDGTACFTNCTNFVSLGAVSLFDITSAVPAGKRLVLRHISGRLFSTQGCGDCEVGLQSSRVISAESLKWSFLGPFFGSVVEPGLIVNGFSADVFVTVGPGENPHVRVQVPGGGTNTIGYIVLSGYLIDAT